VRAVVLRDKGGPEVLRLEEVADPAAGPEEVLVDVVATACNRADLLQRRGLYPGPPAEVEIPGLEFAGRVAAVGDRVRAWSVGDQVMGIVGGGAYAERLAVHERQVLAVPAPVPVADAAAIPEVFFTAFDALVVQGGLTSGRWALVHAGGSGVGTAAIQIAKAIGARILVTASAGKLPACRRLGADEAVDYRAEDFAAVARRVTGGRGVDVVLDVVGGEYTSRNLDALASRGRIIQVGVMGEGTAAVPLGQLLAKRAALVGTVLRARPLEEKIALTQRVGAELLPLFDDGSLRPVIDSRYPLEAVAEAHRRMESNANIGKIVLDVA
jgi:putative PIG3 family NAD(P)H quinone oxidoreductase